MRHEENPLDFPLSLGHLGDLSVYLAPDEEGEPHPQGLVARKHSHHPPCLNTGHRPPSARSGARATSFR